MPLYNSAVVDVEGRLDPVAFRQAFIQSLQHYHYDVNGFLINRYAPAMSEAAMNARIQQHPAPARPALEELSDEEETEEPMPRVMPPAPVRPRLKLVVDLDNTLVHAQSKYKLNFIEPELYDFRDAVGNSELFRFTLPRQPGQAYFLKLRPGAVQFLRDLSAFYDIAVHTNATQEYADVVLSILDPDRTVIGLR